MLESSIFYLSATAFGLGIGIDAGLSTLLMVAPFYRFAITFLWGVGLTLTHTFFPLISFSLSSKGIDSMPTIAPIIGVLTFTLIGYMTIEWYRSELDEDGLAALRQHSGLSFKKMLIVIGLLLAVSLDAVYSGPALTGKFTAMTWQTAVTFFACSGIVVSLLTFCGAVIGKLLANHKVQLSNTYYLLLIWLQFTAIGYFAWLALFKLSFGISQPSVPALLVSLCTTSFLIGSYQRKKIKDALRLNSQ